LFRILSADPPDGQVFAGSELTEGHLKVRFAYAYSRSQISSMQECQRGIWDQN
jgi:hypothetical protein